MSKVLVHTSLEQKLHDRLVIVVRRSRQRRHTITVLKRLEGYPAETLTSSWWSGQVGYKQATPLIDQKYLAISSSRTTSRHKDSTSYHPHPPLSSPPTPNHFPSSTTCQTPLAEKYDGTQATRMISRHHFLRRGIKLVFLSFHMEFANRPLVGVVWPCWSFMTCICLESPLVGLHGRLSLNASLSC